jgi:hypothetical protein
MKRSITVIVLFSLFFFTISAARADCLTVDNNLGCSGLNRNYLKVADNQCTEYVSDESSCCCSSSIISDTKPKYLLIGSVVAFFAIITSLVFFYRKNE